MEKAIKLKRKSNFKYKAITYNEVRVLNIIFMGSPYSDQAQKLLKIANLSNGELFGIKNIKELNPILTELSEKKRVS